MAENSDRSPSVDSPSRLIPQLPDDISVRCIARVPRLFHPTLALISRSWCSLLNSPLLFSVRSALGFSQRFICFSVQLPDDKSQWYLLDPDPQNPKPLLRLPPPPIPTVGYSCTGLGLTISVIGGYLDGIRLPAVQIFDALLNRWSVGPSMWSVGPSMAGAIGGFPAPGLGVWTSVPSPIWSPGPGSRRPGPGSRRPGPGKEVVVDGVRFTSSSMGKIKCYDERADKWMHLEGLKSLDNKQLKLSALANVGGILCGIWEPWARGSGNMMVLEFAGIKVSRTSCGRFWGSLVWTKSVDLAEKGSLSGHIVELEL